VPLRYPWLDVLEQMSYGGAIFDWDEREVRLNSTAKRLLAEHSGIAEAEMEDPARAIAALQALVPVQTLNFSTVTDSWFVVPRLGKRQLIVRTIPLENSVPPDPSAVVILIDLEGVPQLNATTLQEIFDMTAAEAKLAFRMARGDSLPEIAKTENITLAAARSLLAAIFAKTNTRRQSELISLLERVALLP
jgi:DNA-binding CsgD family transcriptional regulator